MATSVQLRADIKKLKGAIASKSTPKSILPKLKTQLQKVEQELIDKKAGKPTKSTKASTKATLGKLQTLVNRTKKLSIYKGTSEANLKNDAERPALATGRRVSKGLKANQSGSKSSNKGHVYYEYRKNRLDIKQPKKKQKYPMLEEGGMMAKGGKIANQYKGRKPEDIWDSWTISQRVHFLKDHYLPNLEKSLNKKEYEHAVNSITEVSLMNWNKLPSSVQMEVERHIFMGQYADGGMMAKGGKLSLNTYKLRAEGLNDFLSFLQTGMYTRMKSFTIEPIGVPDVVVSFVTDASLSEIKSKLKEVADSHVMLETIKPINEYTGERDEMMADGGMMAKGGTTTIKEFGSMSFKNHYDDWEMVVISKGLEKDGGQYMKDRYLVSAKDIEEAKKIATELWEKEMSNSDFHIVKVMSDSLYRMKYMDKYNDGGMMAEGGAIQSKTHKLSK